jgi:hypothetical protein
LTKFFVPTGENSEQAARDELCAIRATPALLPRSCQLGQGRLFAGLDLSRVLPKLLSPDKSLVAGASTLWELEPLSPNLSASMYGSLGEQRWHYRLRLCLVPDAYQARGTFKQFQHSIDEVLNHRT